MSGRVFILGRTRTQRKRIYELPPDLVEKLEYEDLDAEWSRLEAHAVSEALQLIKKRLPGFSLELAPEEYVRYVGRVASFLLYRSAERLQRSHFAEIAIQKSEGGEQ